MSTVAARAVAAREDDALQPDQAGQGDRGSLPRLNSLDWLGRFVSITVTAPQRASASHSLMTRGGLEGWRGYTGQKFTRMSQRLQAARTALPRDHRKVAEVLRIRKHHNP